MGETELREVLKLKIEDARRRMLRNLNSALSSDLRIGRKLSEEEVEELKKIYKRRLKIKKLLKPYTWLKWRVIGTWNLWTSGECGGCEYESD